MVYKFFNYDICLIGAHSGQFEQIVLKRIMEYILQNQQQTWNR